MKTTFVALALAASAMAKPMPAASTPEGCSDSHSGTFEVTVVNVTSSKRSLSKRQLSGTLTLTLEDGILKDQAGRTGYIASNDQWQFDNPPQVNAKSTSGYSYCENNTLALAGSAIFYQCWSGDFYNIYDKSSGKQCSPIYLEASGGDSTPATQLTDGQPQATTIVPVTQISDGQPQPASTAIVISQISDGQPQAPTSGMVVTQISDGQPQAPTSGAVVTQISDGQPQAPTSGMVITQISDGQPQAPTGAPISQISDGQPQAPYPTTTAAPVSQISDGQPQAPVATGNYTINTSAPAEYTGAAATAAYGLGAFAAGAMGMLAML